MLKNLRRIATVALLFVPLSSWAASAIAPAPGTSRAQLVEYYNYQRDHYFMTAQAAEIAALDSGATQGWQRTGYQFTVYAAGSQTGSPVCRYYGLPGAGLDSHFYSGSTEECAAVGTKFRQSWILESSNVFEVNMPTRSGVCGVGTVPVYRVFNNRSDANHRYTTDAAVRDAMLARGYIAEGYGSDGVAFCVATPATSPASPNSTLASASIIATATALDTYDFSSIATASSGAAIVSYAWDLGDGNTATGATTSHTYAVSGTYPIVLTVRDSRNAVATARTQVAASKPPRTPPSPTPPSTTPPSTTPPSTTPPSTTPGAPPPAVVSGSDRVKPSYDETTWIYASRQLGARWVSRGGDWVDKDGAFDGPTPTISRVITSSTVTIDISGIDGDLLLQGISGWDAPTIDGRPAVGFWTDASSNRAQALPVRGGSPGIILNPDRGRTLTITTSALGQRLRIDKVLGPTIPDFPMVGSWTTPDIIDLDVTSQAAIKSFIRTGDFAPGDRNQDGTNGVAYNEEYSTDPETGLHYLRFSTKTPLHPRLISWFMKFTPRDDLYVGYGLYIEDDVADGMNELGMKLSGMGTADGVAFIAEHGSVGPANRGVYELRDYRYDAEGTQQLDNMNGVTLRSGRWYYIELHGRMNTIGQADGLEECWVNGTHVWSRTGKVIRTSPASQWSFFHAQIYHGGMTSPSRPFHYRIARIAASSRRIGVPPELSGNLNPAWRAGMAKDRVYAIANTARMNNATAQSNGSGSDVINAWNGLAASDTQWWSAANGGHGVWSNSVFKLDLAGAAPQWSMIDPGSTQDQVVTDGPVYRDGRWVSRHSYYTSQFIKARNRIMHFGISAPYAIGMPGAQYQGGYEVDGFDPATKRWDALGTYPSLPNMNLSPVARSVAKHPINEDVYISSNGVFAKWTQSVNTMTVIRPGFPSGIDSALMAYEFKPSLIDAARNRWVHLHRIGPSLQFIDLATYAYTQLAVSGPLTTVENYSPLVHDLNNDRYITIQGDKMYAIDPTTGVSTVIASVPAPTAGAHNRLAYFKALGGVAYLPSFDSNVLFLPTR